ncbi:uroporphyrinogen-III C-methyltransferase [Pelagerythrobacter marinus]|uniref:uroporphyrinogen-III C-methyltransferase n=1 Tax=Pelagerythrobacter marinus TaxID=538382 RepID=UPI00203690A7|nr:uroporphyrinogen-III C-methyltransferase [Pelagerythrobacter marinus]USA40105.1 uroporphyrinogen-III C-methyltransferase [Pelagerythrobacter marinus]WPZ05773.1 uroporphyrinogen-III C-methyltransferase [Pelagerythrobacter marinus]
MTDFEPRTVWLVGAGPGDPELLTRKAERLLSGADVVFHDALVGPGVLALARPGARLVPVGKRAGRHSQSQARIDRMIVAAARAGQRVVRLKGGDPAVFARTAEELAACRAAGVPVRICPGITAASSAAASLGTPLTLRGQARALTFVTAHACAGDAADVDWQALADPGATLAIYMGKAMAGRIARRLIAAGLDPATPVALVENASLPDERRFDSRLDLLPIAARSVLGEGPAVILVGPALDYAREPAAAPDRGSARALTAGAA